MTQDGTNQTSISPIGAQAYADLGPASGTIEVEVVCKTPKLQTVMYSPLHRALVLLDECEWQSIEEATNTLNQRLSDIEQLEQQYQQALSASLNSTKSDALASQLLTQREQLAQTLGIAEPTTAVVENTWLELHALDEPGKVMLAPAYIIENTGKKRLFELIPEMQPESGFARLQRDNGQIDDAAFKEAFKKASIQLKTEWQLGDGRNEQISVRDVFPSIIADLLSEHSSALDALDDVIASWNEALVWQSGQYQAQHEDALRLLQEDPFTFEAFGRVQQLCSAIWQDESPMRRYRYNQLFGGEGQDRIRAQLIEQVKQKELPPARWQSGAEASLMRFTTKITLAADFKPRDGLLGLELKGDMRIAVAQGSIIGSVYYPHDQGQPLSFSANTLSKSVRWEVFGHCTPATPCFREGATFIDQSGLLALASALAEWQLTAQVLSGYQIVVFGHDDHVTVPDINDTLSRARSDISYALLTFRTEIWKACFETGEWGHDERNEMARVIGGTSSLRSDDELITEYFDYFHRHVGSLSSSISTRSSNPHRLWFAQRDFALSYVLPSTQVHQYLASQTDQAFDKRISIVVLEAKEQPASRNRTQLRLGHVRAKLSTTLAGFAGANVALAGQLAIDVSGGAMALGRMNENAGNGVGAEAELFAGAKLEAGVAAELEWKAPDEENSLFEILGTAGYIVSGQAGVGLTGQLKIGFDDRIQRFVIKVKAALCLGLGVGGKLEVTVDAKQVWSFLRLVHEQLMRVDFNWVDLFDEEVYDYFVAWSYELINQGYWLRGTAVLGTMEVASKAVELLSGIREIENSFKSRYQSRSSLQKLMSFLSETENSLQLRFTAPEVKGRILYLLLHTPSAAWIDEHITNHVAQRQNHIVHLLQVGVQSQREYLEVLEHTLGASEHGRTAQQRCQQAAEVHAELRAFIDEHQRTALAQWWEGLSDPSGCLCIGSTAAVNPFN